MSNRPVLHKVRPQNTKANYLEYDIVDFVISAPGRKFVGNSFRLEGRIKCFTDSGASVQKVETENIFIDPAVGANALWEDITTVTDNQGQLENLKNAPRYHKMAYSASNRQSDALNSSHTCEMKAVTLEQVSDYLNGQKLIGTATADPNTQTGTSFSCKPLFILNQVSPAIQGGNVNVSSARTGNIRISVRMARNEAVFYGMDSDTDTNYSIADLALVFKSVPEDGNQMPLLMRHKSLVRQTVQSSFANFNTNVNGLVNGVSISFLDASKDNQPAYNQLDLDQLPDVSQIQYLFNDSNNRYVTYNYNTQQEYLTSYAQSLQAGENNNSISQENIKGNYVWGLGQPFREFIDLSQNAFGMNINSNVGAAGAATSYILFSYFHGMLTFQ